MTSRCPVRPLHTSPACLASKRPHPASDSSETITGTSIRILRTVPAIRNWRRSLPPSAGSIALVPTMGGLHAGHAALIRAALRDNDQVVVSIFLNPAQFGPTEDLATYPASLPSDLDYLGAIQEAENDERKASPNARPRGRISAVFAPSAAEIYPPRPTTTLAPSSGRRQDPAAVAAAEAASGIVMGHGTFVTVTPVGDLLEGRSRPGFFRGVATVCLKLFNIVGADRVYFGQKDVQQTVVIRQLVRDMHMLVEVVVVPTERMPDGLALSTRNMYLGERRRRVAPVLYKALRAGEAVYQEKGGLHRSHILQAAESVLEEVRVWLLQEPKELRAAFKVDYLSLADPETMEEVQSVDPDRGAIISGAIYMLPRETPQPGEDLGDGGGNQMTRLIDNIILNPKRGEDEGNEGT